MEIYVVILKDWTTGHPHRVHTFTSYESAQEAATRHTGFSTIYATHLDRPELDGKVVALPGIRHPQEL